MQRFFQFTITSDARRQIPKMILERLVDEYIWQSQQCQCGAASVKDRAKRVCKLVEAEINRRNVQKDFDRLLNRRMRELEMEQQEKTGS
ncbi:hypothetical protein [Phosphitispora sp. TUW77]|uniref:hypothetical protein n=1 Tax=Phosphitispora sp. TUW77 TaxID=3152361 RepID=UPI003AB19749